MAASVPTQEPERIYAGETVIWTRALTDYPQPTWTLKFGLTKADGTDTITAISSTDDGDGIHLLTIADTITTDMAAGDWRWQTRIEKTSDGSEKKVLEQGRLEVRPDIIAGAVDARADVEASLDALTLMIRGKATKDVASYTINGRSLASMTPSELQAWKAALQAEVLEIENRERLELNKATPQKIRASL